MRKTVRVRVKKAGAVAPAKEGGLPKEVSGIAERNTRGRITRVEVRGVVQQWRLTQRKPANGGLVVLTLDGLVSEFEEGAKVRVVMERVR